MIELNQHIFICGVTRSGKTFFTTELYKQSDNMCIFFNVQDVYDIERCSDAIVYDIEGLNEAIENNKKKICVSPIEGGSDIDINLIEYAIKLVMALGAVKRRTLKRDLDKDIWCEVYIDEIQEYGEKAGNPIIRRILKRGISYGIVARCISQRPADTDHTILTQSKLHIIFNMGDYESSYFRNYNIPIEENKSHLDKEYHFITWNQKNAERYKPIKTK